MTSTNDGKDVKSNLSSRPKDKTYYIELYKSLEARLSGEGSLPARTAHVCEAWRRVYSLHQHSAPSTHPHLLSWLQRHTAHTVLQTEWVQSKDEQIKLGAAIDALVAEAAAAAADRDELPWERQLLARAHWFKSVLADPWGHPVLKSLLAKEPVTDEQVLEWLISERGLVFTTRLRQLAAFKCVDLALLLAAGVMERARRARPPLVDGDIDHDADHDADHSTEPEEDDASFYSVLRRDAGFLDVWDLLTDIEFVLLDKQHKRDRIIELAKQTPLCDGYQLVERLRNRLETCPRDKKLWKNAKEVATLIAQVVIARCMVVPSCTGAGRTALYCCARSLARLVPPPRLAAVTAALAAPAATARHLHTLCAAIHAQCEGDMKPFVCELYVRAITAGMNELERLKLNAQKQAEARLSEQTLASWFTQLGTLLGASARLRAECALTAFSVHPAPNMYERVRRAPRPPPLALAADTQDSKPESTSDFGSWANDSRSQSNLVKTSETLQLKHTQHQANVLSTAILTEGEALGLGAELGQDLAVLLSGPRVKTLSWDMDRELLLENCRAYMERTHGGTRALTTELKYLNLDPRAFQHLPEEGDDENDLYYGIEKGFEHLVQFEEPEEIWQNAFFDPEHTESANDSEVEDLIISTKKKNKAPIHSSDEEDDPLSLIADAKKEKKSKEKSKEHRRKKSHKRDTSKDGKERRKDKPKKERKKKSDQPTTGSLTSLLGMKVTNMPSKVQDGEKRVRKKKERRRVDPLAQIGVTDSDYDSQVKQLQGSDHDPTVLFDGLFSMDELKSPERRKSDDNQKAAEVSLAVRNSTMQSPVDGAKPGNPVSSPKVRSTASDDSDVSRTKSPYLTPNPRGNRHVVNDKVKKSITKLLQFRRNKPKTSDVPKIPLAPSSRTDNLTSPVPNQSLIGMKIHNADKIPKVFINKYQSSQLEAIKNEIDNLYHETRSSEHVPKIPFNKPASIEPKLMSPPIAHSAQRQQDVRYQQYNNPMPNIVQNPSVFSECQKAYSDYVRSSPQKQSLYGYTVNQAPRSTSVIDTSYISPSKQTDKPYALNLNPTKSSDSRLTHQTYHKSMQNLTQNDDVNFDLQKYSKIDPKYCKQYSKSNAQENSQRIASNTPVNATIQAQSQTYSLNSNSTQHQTAAMAKARDDYIKFYQTIPNINGIHQTSPSKQMNSQVSSNFKADVVHDRKQLSTSMQENLHETLEIVSNDFAKDIQSRVPRPAHSNNAKSYVNSQAELSQVQRNYPRDNKLQSQHFRLIQNSNQDNSSNVRDITVKQPNVPPKQMNQDNFKEFLKELQNSINAGVTDCEKSINLNKEVKVTPVNQASTSTPAKKLDLTHQCAKQLIQQKKSETAPNTFSRLSYLHKNKQSEIKLKESTTINLELCKTILDNKMNKAKYLKNDVTISRVDQRNPVSSKANTKNSIQKDCPLLTRMLDASPKEPKGTCQTSTSMSNVSQNSTSDKTNREHADLLLLLRNQPTLKIPINQTRLPPTSDVGTSLAVSNTISKAVNQVPVMHQRTQDDCASTLTAFKGKNVDLSVVRTQEDRDCTKDKTQQDWESVMNALRAHSTPPLGPNALDMVLKKDYRKPTSSRSHASQKLKSSGTSSSQNKTCDTKKRDRSSRSGSLTRKTSTEKQAETAKRHNESEVIKKTPQPEAAKRPQPSSKQFTSNPPKEVDPFISGIHNSDYDLLGELIDDDLRRELGELSSDEESYPSHVAVSTKAKGSCNVQKINTNACTKVADVSKDKTHVIEPKAICKNTPDVKVTGLNLTKTSMNTPKSGHANVITNHPGLPDSTKLPVSRICSNMESQPMPTNIVVNHTDSNHYIANIAASNQPTNLIITSIPAQPMVLISQELVYDPYPTIQIHESQVSAGLCNVTQNAYVTLNPAPNIALYTTQQFAAPVINPVIIGNAMTTTNVTTAMENQQVNPHYVKEEVKPVKETETNSVIENSVTEESNTEGKHANSDPNVNKNSERKVLSQMQENNTYDSGENDTRIKRLSVDSNQLKTKQDEERIKMKRQLLMNRTINQPCFHPPIVLTYTPLGERNNLEKLLQQGTPKNGTVISNLKLKSNNAVVDKETSVKTSVENPKCEINNENIESTDKPSSTKENQKMCRRILLRSSKKLENKGTPGKIKRVRLRRNKFKPKSNELSSKDANTNNTQKKVVKIETDTNTTKRTSKRILNKTKVQVEETKSNTASSLEITQMQDIKEESSESKLNPVLGLIDFENELSGSKILKKSPSQQKLEVDEELITVKSELDLKESKNNNVTDEEGPKTVENNKVVQINTEKSAVLDDPKLTSVSNDLDPSVLLKKLKNNLGNQLVIKRPPVITKSKKSIVMTIKNQNQAILANETTSKDKQGSKGNNDRKSQKKSLKKIDVNSTIKVAQKKIVAPILNKIDSSTPCTTDNKEQQLKPKPKEPKEALSTVKQKNCTDLATKNPQVKKTNLSTPSIADNNEPNVNATISNQSKIILPTVQQKGGEELSVNSSAQSLPDDIEREFNPKIIKQRKAIIPTQQQKDGTDLTIKNIKIINENSIQPQTLPVKISPPGNKKSLLLPITKPDSTISTEVSPVMQNNFNRTIVPGQKTNNLDSKPTNQINSVVIVPNPDKQTLFTNKDKKTNRSLMVDSIGENKGVDKSLICHETMDQESCKKNSSQPHVPQFRKEDITIEEIPVRGNTDPTKKCVRVRLPNGKVFKATVSGRMNIDYDSLFAEPSMRAILAGGLNDGKRYTLNIKQVSKAIKTNPSKILDTKIREINIKEKKPVPIDIVNLISDDEDDDVHTFSTEFGKFTTKTDLETLTKHQKKFSQKCIVKLYRHIIYKSNRTKPKPRSFPNIRNSLLTRNKSKLVNVQQTDALTVPEAQILPAQAAPVISTLVHASPIIVGDDIPDVSVKQKQPTNAQSVPTPLLTMPVITPKQLNTPEVIEIDDSSNDSIEFGIPIQNGNLEPVKKIVEFKSLLLKDLGVDVKDKEIVSSDKFKHPEKVTAVENFKNALLDDLGVAETTEKITENQQAPKHEPIQAENATTVKKSSRKCVIKIPKCDDLVMKHEMIKNLKRCFVMLKRCDHSLAETTNVISSDGLSENEENEVINLDYSDDFIDFDVEEAEVSPKLSRCPSLSILNNLWDDTCHPTTKNLYGRSSPVMEIYEALVSLHNKSEENIVTVKEVEKLWQTCDSEWTKTKHAYSIQEKIDTRSIKETLSVCSDLECPVISNVPPKLITIALKFLEDNPYIVHRLQLLRKAEHMVLIDSSVKNLKRKAEQPAHNTVANKVLKLGSLAVNAINTYSEIITKVSTNKSLKAESDIISMEEEKECSLQILNPGPHSVDNHIKAKLVYEPGRLELPDKDLDYTLSSSTDNKNEHVVVNHKHNESCDDKSNCDDDFGKDNLLNIEIPKAATQKIRKTENDIIDASSEDINTMVRSSQIVNDSIVQEPIECFKIGDEELALTPIEPEQISKVLSQQIESVLGQEYKSSDKNLSDAKITDFNGEKAINEVELALQPSHSSTNSKMEAMERQNKCAVNEREKSALIINEKSINNLNMTCDFVESNSDDHAIVGKEELDYSENVSKSTLIPVTSCLDIDKEEAQITTEEYVSSVDCATSDYSANDDTSNYVTQSNENVKNYSIEVNVIESESTYLEGRKDTYPIACEVIASDVNKDQIDSEIQNDLIPTDVLEHNATNNPSITVDLKCTRDMNKTEELDNTVTAKVKNNVETSPKTREIYSEKSKLGKLQDIENVNVKSIVDGVNFNADHLLKLEGIDYIENKPEVVEPQTNISDKLHHNMNSDPAKANNDSVANSSKLEEVPIRKILEDTNNIETKQEVVKTQTDLSVRFRHNKNSKSAEANNDILAISSTFDEFRINEILEDTDNIERNPDVVKSQTNISDKLHHNMNSEPAEANNDTVANSSTLDEVPIREILDDTDSIVSKLEVVKSPINISIKLHHNMNSDPAEANNDTVANSSTLDEFPMKEILEYTDNFENKPELVKTQTDLSGKLHDGMDKKQPDEVLIRKILEVTDNTENKTDVVRSQPDCSVKLQHNIDYKLADTNSNSIAKNNALDEVPIEDLPYESYEIEITDTRIEDIANDMLISREIHSQNLVTDELETSSELGSPVCEIKSPLFIDNKEIMFNFHDYTKQPKIKEVHPTISDKQSNDCMSNEHKTTFMEEKTSSVAEIDNLGCKNLSFKRQSDLIGKEGSSYGSTAKIDKCHNKINPDFKYELIQEDDWLTVITTETDKDTSTDIEVEDPIQKSEHIVEDTKIPATPKTEVTLQGIEYKDPIIGMCYVFTLDASGSSASNISSESLGVLSENSDDNNSLNTFKDADLYDNLHDIEFCVIAPKNTYSRRSLKRKMNMRDLDVVDKKYRKGKNNEPLKIVQKRYRKGKNIDCCKQTVNSRSELAYGKEYKQLMEYCSSVKFSYARPFHKECFEVDAMTTNWPTNKALCYIPEESADENLFVDLVQTPAYQPDPATQTLTEEIAYQYTNKDALDENESDDEGYETNFNMGFGERSGRVIQNLKKGSNSNISAATLSDVKQSQPFLVPEDYDNLTVLKTNKDDQIKKMRQYVTFIELRDKVRSFFKKTSVELKCEWMQENVKECDRLVAVDFPYDLCSLDYLKPSPTETIVQVVQLGQLPVSAAAQNPVTCDPRVTQVSDASPSQCSGDNSPNDDSQSEIKTEYTELTTADLTLPLVQEYAQQNQPMNLDPHDENNLELTEQTISLEMEIKAEEKPEIKEEIPDINEEGSNSADNTDLHTLTNATPQNIEYLYESNTVKSDSSSTMYDSSEQNSSETFSQQRLLNGPSEKTDQIAHAMNAAGITTTPESNTSSRAHALVNILSQKIRQDSVNTTQTTTNTYSKTTSINAMALQQALAQILPPPLNQTNSSENNQTPSTPVGPQVLHIVQGKNASGNQITLVDNTQQSVISTPNATQVLHIVQNKGATTGQATNGTLSQQSNSFSGLSLVDAGLQQGGNQLLHIVNTGNQKNATPGQLLKRVNLLTNLTNVQGSNEQKMVQFVCKSADGKAIQLNAPHQRSMVLRLQPIETSNVQNPPAKSADNQELSPSPTNSASGKEGASQQEIKSRSIYEENYAKFIQNSSGSPNAEKATSLPKFNQAFGKSVFQDVNQKQGEVPSSNSHLPSVNTNSENNDCPVTDNAINLEHIGQISSPPLLLRKQPAVTSQSQSNLVQQIKQTIAPMNIQTMHGGVIYTRQIPVNIGGGQTINLITVPSTELINEDNSKQQTANQSEVEPSIIKIVPQNQNTTNTESSQEENNSHMNASNENAQNPPTQPVLTQMRIKLPMLSKAPQMVPGARVVRPSFFQIQRNVIGGANQPVYQQLVLTAAPPLGQQTIRLPQAQATRKIKVPSENQSSSESQMSSSTLEQLREFDMVLEQVKERSTVQPSTNSNNNTFKIHNTSSDNTDGTGSNSCSNESTQVLYSIGNNQSLNVAYVNRKTAVTTSTTSTYVRSPDSSGIADSPTSSTHVQIPHTVTTDSSPTDMSSQSKPPKVSSKSKSRPKSTSNPPNTLKLNTVPPKTSSQKPLEDEQTTQRILYILAEYKEQVENSPDKDKPAPRRRSNPPSNPGSSKRKKSSSSRRSGTRDMSPVHGEDTCRTMGSEDSSCGTSQGDCTESCLDSHSPQDSPRKVARKITFDQDPPLVQTRPLPQRNVIVADGQTITVARSATGKPATAVLMPANYILPVSMMKGGQQIAIVTNRGPKLLTVGGEAGAANALLLQRLIGPGGLKPVLARPGVRHVRLPTAALHNLQAFNLATATAVQPPDSTASPTPGPTPPELSDTRATSSPWADRDDVKPERGSSPEGSEPWNLQSSAEAHEYTYEETVRTDNMDRTVLDPIPDRYSPDMEAQRIFDKMFDVDSKKSYAVDSPRCAYDIDASDCDDKAYQVVQKKDGTQRQHRLSHVSAAALRHKYAILEHELRLQKSLSEECEDLGVDSPSASELFPEAELLFAASPAHEHNQDAHHSHTPQPTQSTIPQPDMDDQIATDHLIPREIDVSELGDVGIVAVSEDGMQATIALDQEEFARSHPNTTFHSEPTEGEVSSVQPFTIAGLKGRHITSTIFHSNSAPATVLMAAPQATVISQAPDHGVKYEIENMINSMPSSHTNEVNLSSVLVKDDGLTRFDSILTDSRELHLSNTASAIVHSSGNATQVIRRVCYEDDKRERDTRFLIDEPDHVIAGDDAKMIAEDNSRDATLESMADVDDDRSSPERHAELFWESNSASERSESRRPLDFSSDSDKCCKSPSFDETNSTDSSGVGTHMRLDSVIKEARGRERSGSADGSSADDTHPPLRTYPPKRLYHPLEEAERSLSGKTRAGERSPDSLEVRRRASGRGVVKRGCHCCNGSPVPLRPKKPRQRKPTLDFNTNN